MHVFALSCLHRFQLGHNGSSRVAGVREIFGQKNPCSVGRKLGKDNKAIKGDHSKSQNMCRCRGNGEAEKMTLCRDFEVGTLDASGPITLSLWWGSHFKLLPFLQILK